MVCVTLDVTAATTTTAAVMAPSILWAFISSLARLRRVEEASLGDPGRFLLLSMVLIVTGEIPRPILHCGRGHTLDTRALDDLICLKKNQNAPRPSEHPPVKGEKMSKRLGGIKGCKYKTSSWHLNGFPDGNNIGSTV